MKIGAKERHRAEEGFRHCDTGFLHDGAACKAPELSFRHDVSGCPSASAGRTQPLLLPLLLLSWLPQGRGAQQI